MTKTRYNLRESFDKSYNDQRNDAYSYRIPLTYTSVLYKRSNEEKRDKGIDAVCELDFYNVE